MTIIHEEKKLLEWLKWVEIDSCEIEVTKEYYDNFIKSLGDLSCPIITKDYYSISVTYEDTPCGYIPTQIIYVSLDRQKHTIKYFEFEGEETEC